MRATAPEGDALRAAARDLVDRFPDLPGAVVGRLNLLAHRWDTELALREAGVAAHRRARLAGMDTRGRWVRRQNGNAGPGVPGVGHVATYVATTDLDDTEGLCGAVLRGRLDWGHVAAPGAMPQSGWAPCRRCVRVLANPQEAAA